VAVGAPLAALVLSSIGLGELPTAADQLEITVPDTMFQSRFGLHYLQARGQYFLAAQNLPAALGDARFCGMLMREWQVDSPSIVPWRSDAAQALLRMRQPEQAVELLSEQLELVGDRDHRVRGMTLMFLASAGDAGSRAPRLRQAVDALRGSGDRFLLGRAIDELGDCTHPGGPAQPGWSRSTSGVGNRATGWSARTPPRTSWRTSAGRWP
jgi:hypothetical protein